MSVARVTEIISASTKPNADTRMWNNLPLFLAFASLTLPPGQHQATIEFLDGGNVVHDTLTKRITLDIPEGSGDQVIYISDLSIIDIPL